MLSFEFRKTKCDQEVENHSDHPWYVYVNHLDQFFYIPSIDYVSCCSFKCIFQYERLSNILYDITKKYKTEFASINISEIYFNIHLIQKRESKCVTIRTALSPKVA